MAYYNIDFFLYPMFMKQCKKIVCFCVFFIIFKNLKFFFICFLFIIFLINIIVFFFFFVKLFYSLSSCLWRWYKNFRLSFSIECTKIFQPIPELLKLNFNSYKKKYKNVFSLICSFNNLFRAW